MNHLEKFFVVTLALFLTICANGISAQSGETMIKKIDRKFEGNTSMTVGIINVKIRLQYELLLKTNLSTGLNMNYYLKDWKGPLIEPFFRIYWKKYGNSKGFFGQLKLVYGNLKTIEEPYPKAFSNKRWSTYGFGINCGYKFLFGNRCTIEPLTGPRLLTKPVYKCNPGFEEECKEMRTGYESDWFFLTGFPLDFQLKFGIQF